MFNKKFLFYDNYIQTDGNDTSDYLYSQKQGFGFVTENNRKLVSELQIAELNAGFEPYYWLIGEELTKLTASNNGVGIIESNGIPLLFKATVPKQGNYHITVKITAGEKELNDLIIFTGRRRLMARKNRILPFESFITEATVNVSDIIPRGETKRYKDITLDLSILADNPMISELIIEEVECPTLYIAGDSTVTDQGTAYPYHPGNSYCGWGQMLPYYLNCGIAVSNHAHSGLTTETFRSEGHYSIIEEQINPNDYFFLQFGHNDQKLAHLSALGGYTENIIRYIHEIRAKSAIPVIVTPMARNTWKGDGSYNDLLSEYATACNLICNKYHVPIINLHEKSKQFVCREEIENTKRYFFPKDYTHCNDFGGYLMAGYVAKDCLKIDSLRDYLSNLNGISLDISNSNNECNTDNLESDWIPPLKIIQPTPPLEFSSNKGSAYSIRFKDIEQSSNKEAIIALVEEGVISNAEDTFHGSDLITRVEALDWVVNSVRFVPTKVYNDRFSDVIGHEWYAGLVEVICQNEILNTELTADGKFHPFVTVTAEQLISFCVTSYKCRKRIKSIIPDIALPDVSSWAASDVSTAIWLNFITKDFMPKKELTREEAVVYIKCLIDSL